MTVHVALPLWLPLQGPPRANFQSVEQSIEQSRHPGYPSDAACKAAVARLRVSSRRDGRPARPGPGAACAVDVAPQRSVEGGKVGVPGAGGLADYVLAERGHVIHAAEHATVRGPGQNEAFTGDPNVLAGRYPAASSLPIRPCTRRPVSRRSETRKSASNTEQSARMNQQ